MAENRDHCEPSKAELHLVENALQKWLPHRLPQGPNDIYVNMKTDFKGQLGSCQKLLDGKLWGQSACVEIYIHGLGLDIICAIYIALQLQAGSFRSLWVASCQYLHCEAFDELEPESGTQEPLTSIRNNSAIHIPGFRVTLK